MIDHVAIVGGGFSGTLLAINLVRHGGPRVTLIEKREEAGRGVAYGDADPAHLLNVRAANMSAFPDQPDHFVRWLRRRGHSAEPGTFVGRSIYGSYLRELLEEAATGHPGQVRLVSGTAMNVVAEGDGERVVLEEGEAIGASRVVLAIGNLPPLPPASLGESLATSRHYVANPWAEDSVRDLQPDKSVLVLGTGLTMVDVVLKLTNCGFGGQIVAISRRGLVPRSHDAQAAFQPGRVRPAPVLPGLLRHVRERSLDIGWRNAVDELRPFTQSLWRGADERQRARFLRHLRPWWDVHRHRIAPQVHEQIAALMETGRLRVVAAKTERFELHGDEVAVTFRHRSTADVETRAFQRVINCMGPQGDLARTSDPLLQNLHAQGLLRPDSARLGIDVDTQGRAIDRTGRASDWLMAVGPMTRGAFWEVVAVPDIRRQVWSIARKLSNAHWVEGEGL